MQIVPVLSNWEEILFLTKPEEWSPSASYQATRLFASNLNQRMAQRFYSLILLPRVRENIAANRRLHFWLYQALKKALYKSAAFYKGILLPLCEVRHSVPTPRGLFCVALMRANRRETARCGKQ